MPAKAGRREQIMSKRAIISFFAGLVISYTIEILVMTFAVVLAGQESIPVFMIVEAFGLAACCSLIGAVFSSDKLSFLLQAALTYIFSFVVIILFSFMFKWYDLGHGMFKGKSFFVIIIGLFTIGYILILLIRWVIQKKRMKLMNAKLTEYKENNEKRR